MKRWDKSCKNRAREKAESMDECEEEEVII